MVYVYFIMIYISKVFRKVIQGQEILKMLYTTKKKVDSTNCMPGNSWKLTHGGPEGQYGTLAPAAERGSHAAGVVGRSPCQLACPKNPQKRSGWREKK